MNYLMLNANSINVNKLLLVMAIVAVVAVIFAVLIVLVSKICYVKPNEKAEAISEHLAGANCGGCGYAGCSDFAKALSEGRAELSSCGPTSNEGKAKIAKILDIPFSAEEERYVVVHCAGGDRCKDKFEYFGNDGCIAQSTFQGGKKVCPTGCLGSGSCVEVCPYHAIEVKNHVAVANKALCEACGLCVKTCPKKIVELIPKSSKVYVACSTHCRGKEVMGACEKGCIGCGICAKNCPSGAITMNDNIPVIDYTKCTGCKICANKCPRKCIWEI